MVIDENGKWNLRRGICERKKAETRAETSPEVLKRLGWISRLNAHGDRAVMRCAK
jgi:hypothetical protein